jgi:hypothetical protein
VSSAQEREPQGRVPWNRFPARDLLREEDENQTTGGFALSYPCSTLPGMSWTRGLLALLAVCVLLVTGSVSCGRHGAQEHKDGQSVSPVGKVLDDTDHEGRHYREVDKDNAPDVGIEVQPDTDDGWSVRLTVKNFAFSPAATKAKAVSGRGVAVLFVDDRPVTTLRTPSCRLASAYVPQGTHKVTARLYADDGTVWAVDGAPVESTADVTASKPEPTGGGGSESGAMGGVVSDSGVTRGVGGAWESGFVPGAGGGPSESGSVRSASRARPATSTGDGATAVQLAVSSESALDAPPGTGTGGGVLAVQVDAGTGGEPRVTMSAGPALAAQPVAGVGGVPVAQTDVRTVGVQVPPVGTGARGATAAQLAVSSGNALGAQPVTSTGAASVPLAGTGTGTGGGSEPGVTTDVGAATDEGPVGAGGVLAPRPVTRAAAVLAVRPVTRAAAVLAVRPVTRAAAVLAPRPVTRAAAVPPPQAYARTALVPPPHATARTCGGR